MKPNPFAKQYRRETSQLLRSITDLLESDPQVKAAWLFGSQGRGEADELSDLDLFVVVDGEPAAGGAARLRSETSRIGTPLLFVDAPQNAPRAGAYLMACYDAPTAPHIVDWYWQPRSLAYIPPEVRVLFDRAGLPRQDQPVAFGGQAPDADSAVLPDRFISFFWMMLMITAKQAARDPGSEKMRLLPYLLDPIARARHFLGQEQALSPISTLPQRSAAEKMGLLSALADEMGRLMAAVSARGVEVPGRVLPGAYRSLGLVDAILQRASPSPG